MGVGLDTLVSPEIVTVVGVGVARAVWPFAYPFPCCEDFGPAVGEGVGVPTITGVAEGVGVALAAGVGVGVGWIGSNTSRNDPAVSSRRFDRSV